MCRILMFLLCCKFMVFRDVSYRTNIPVFRRCDLIRMEVVKQQRYYILIISALCIHEDQRPKTYLRTYAPCDNSDQPAHSRRLIRIVAGRILDRQGRKVSSIGQRTLIRLLGSAGWFESSWGAHIRRYVFSCWGSYYHATQS